MDDPRSKKDNERFRPQSDPDSSIEGDSFSGNSGVGIVISKGEPTSIIEASVNKAVSQVIGKKWEWS